MPIRRTRSTRAPSRTSTVSPSAPRLLLVGHRVAPAEGASALARRVLEEEGRVIAHAPHQRLGGREVLLVLAREADDDVGRERDTGHARPEPSDQRLVLDD